jgi:MFS family permease
LILGTRQNKDWPRAELCDRESIFSMKSESEAVVIETPAINTPWWNELTRYHWFVLAVTALGWLFDCLDQQLFNLARVPAMKALLPGGQNVAEYGGYATAIFLIGWASGGLMFGVLGDRIGRARTMMLTILIYSLCTGLSALSRGFWDFAFYRFITGLGVGGEFAVGVALVAEVMPDRARPHALGLLQALSALGNISAALISIGFGQLESNKMIAAGTGWRWMFVVGAVPALLSLLIWRRLKEPERWKNLAASGRAEKKLGSYAELFGNPNWRGPAMAALFMIVFILGIAFYPDPNLNKLGINFGLAIAALALGLWTVLSGPGSPWRKRAIVGVLLAFCGVVGLWGIGFFSIDLIRSVLQQKFTAPGEANKWAGITSMMLNIGAFFGIYGFGSLSQRIGRKPTFAIAFVLAWLSTAMVFKYLNDFSQIFWMIPIMGFCQLSIFGGYAIYFPELFPTSLRSTGTSFCYNVGRFVAASGPTVLGLLTSRVYANHSEPMRYAGLTMCSIFLVALVILPFAPETKGEPLPEEDRGFAH